MFENLFTSSSTLWFTLIGVMIGLPVLIHLINRLRPRKIEWAAMEFLLRSHRRHRNWIWLKQLLLLLSRIGALLLTFLLLSEVGCRKDRLTRLLGGATTHHYILLDDSFSMSDRGPDGIVFDRALSILTKIGERAQSRENQFVTVVRYSTVRHALKSEGPVEKENPGESAALDPIADLNEVRFDGQTEVPLNRLLGRLSVSSLRCTVGDALRIVGAKIANRKHENAIVYVVSDFRQYDWESSESVAKDFETIYRAGAAIEMIRCATSERPNLAITELEPAGHVRVIGTPLMMKITVKNESLNDVSNVQVKINSMSMSSGNRNQEGSSKGDRLRTDELPAVFFQSIPAGQSATRQFPVYFETTGQQVVLADLPDDAIAIDNRGWNVVTISPSSNVLLIDNSAQSSSDFLRLALNPNRMTGIQAEIRSKDFLRSASLGGLSQFDVIFLLDVDTLEESAVKNLTAFVTGGGGVGIFTGPRVNFEFYNRQLFNDGDGILPMPLSKVFEIPELLTDKVPDFQPQPHPIFAPVLNLKSSLLSLVQIQQIVIPPIEWPADSLAATQVLATVRGQSKWPLVLEKQSGAGRVVLFTTTVGPEWNNWSRNATFPPILLLLHDYLAAGNYAETSHLAGTPIEFEVPAEEFQRRGEFRLIASRAAEESSNFELDNELILNPSPQNSGQLEVSVGKYIASEHAGETDEPGIYDVQLTKLDFSLDLRRSAVNPDPVESMVQLSATQKLHNQLADLFPIIVDWNKIVSASQQPQALPLHRILLVALVIVLLLEQ